MFYSPYMTGFTDAERGVKHTEFSLGLRSAEYRIGFKAFVEGSVPSYLRRAYYFDGPAVIGSSRGCSPASYKLAKGGY